MIKNLILLLFFILLLLPIIHSQGNINTLSSITPQKDIGFAIYQFDIFRCYPYGKSRYDGSLPLEYIKLNETTSNLLLENLRFYFKEPKKVQDYIIMEHDFYNSSYEVNYFLKNQYGDIVGFNTDGNWWIFFYIKANISLDDYTALSDYNKKVFYHLMDDAKIWISTSYENMYKEITNKNVDCQMESGYRYTTYFHAFNFFVQNYFDKLGCTFSNDSIIADCGNSEIFKLIPINSQLLFRENTPKLNSYKVYNSFITLNQKDIKKAEREYDFDILGSQLIISEYPVFRGGNRGHGAYLDMFEYFKNLKNIELKIKKIEYLNRETISKSENLTRILSEVSIIASSDKNVKEKQEELNKLKIENYDFSNFIKHELTNLGIEIINKERFFNREKDTFYGNFYNDITQDYLNNYKISLNELKSNLGYYQENLRYLHSYLTQVSLNLQFQIESERNAAYTNENIKITLIAILTSIGLFVFGNIYTKYGFQFMLVAIFLISIFWYILLKFSNFNGPVIGLLIITFEFLLWIWTPLFFIDYKKYFKFKELKLKTLVNEIYHYYFMNLLVDLYINSSLNSDFQFHNKLRELIFKRIDKIIIEENKILSLIKIKELSNYKNKKLLNNFINLRTLAFIYKDIITSAVYLEKIKASIDKEIFESYIKKLDKLSEVSLEEFFPNKIFRPKIAEEGTKIK